MAIREKKKYASKKYDCDLDQDLGYIVLRKTALVCTYTVLSSNHPRYRVSTGMADFQ